jgi:hypothetical protein
VNAWFHIIGDELHGLQRAMLAPDFGCGLRELAVGLQPSPF